MDDPSCECDEGTEVVVECRNLEMYAWYVIFSVIVYLKYCHSYRRCVLSIKCVFYCSLQLLFETYFALITL
jgi:hypothetical protein